MGIVTCLENRVVVGSNPTRGFAFCSSEAERFYGLQVTHPHSSGEQDAGRSVRVILL